MLVRSHLFIYFCMIADAFIADECIIADAFIADECIIADEDRSSSGSARLLDQGGAIFFQLGHQTFT